LDYNAAEGRTQYDMLGLTVLPAFIFDQSVSNSEGYVNMTDYFDAAGDRLLLRVNSPWDPYCDPAPEHCGQERCALRISCRQETPRQLGVYVTSFSPQGIEAINSLKDLLPAFNGQINVTVNYIGELDGKGMPTSPMGRDEVDEDLRQLCAMKIYPDGLKYLDYIWCRNRNLTGNWSDCARETGLNATEIETCAGGEEGNSLISASFRETRQLGIINSPTFLINNKKRFVNAVSASQIREGICSANNDLDVCGKNLTSTGPAR
jgi:hypothetical protein